MNRFGELAKIWDEAPYRVENTKKIGQAIVKNVPLSKNWKVLDLGAGTGLLTFYIQPYVKAIDAIDNSQGMLEKLKEKAESANILTINPILKDLEKDNLGENEYDAIISSKALHHMKDITSFLRKLYKTLKKGAYLAIADLEKEDGDFHSDNDRVYYFGFSKEELENYFKEAGLENFKFLIVNKIEKNNKEYPIFLAIGKK